MRCLLSIITGLLLFGSAVDAGAQDLRTRWEGFKANFHLVTERNKAWPKPFQCHDVQAYYSFWQPMYNRGWEHHCTLADVHFDADTQQLNRLGTATLMSIAQHTPAARRMVFVYDNGDHQQLEARMAAVRETLAGNLGNPEAVHIAATDRPIQAMQGSKIEVMNQTFMRSQPVPTIPAANPNTSTTGSGG